MTSDLDQWACGGPPPPRQMLHRHLATVPHGSDARLTLGTGPDLFRFQAGLESSRSGPVRSRRATVLSVDTTPPSWVKPWLAEVEQRLSGFAEFSFFVRPSPTPHPSGRLPFLPEAARRLRAGARAILAGADPLWTWAEMELDFDPQRVRGPGLRISLSVHVPGRPYNLQVADDTPLFLESAALIAALRPWLDVHSGAVFCLRIGRASGHEALEEAMTLSFPCWSRAEMAM